LDTPTPEVVPEEETKVQIKQNKDKSQEVRGDFEKM
jgi:hypothetical protein